MPEQDVIQPDSLPQTVDSLAEQFAACGLAAGQTVIVHTRMSAIGWIAGGALAVIQALLRVLGDDGTLMMPTNTTDNTDPADWVSPPVPESWWQVIRQHMPAYDPIRTPTRNMGAVAELFRTLPGVLRSAHPVGSLAAYGRHADYLTSSHHLEHEFSDDSPIGRLYELDSYVMLIGVGHGNDTSLHLAEQRAEWHGKRRIRAGSAIFVNGQRQWVEYKALDLQGEDFDRIGDSYEAAHGIERGRVGQAEVRFMRMRPLVDYAVRWIEQNRR